MNKIGIIGLGNMGYAIYNSVKNKFETLTYDPFKKYDHITQTKNISELSERSDVIILCVKPDKIVEIIKEFQSPKILISVAAGISIETIKKNSFPNSKIVRIMPNLPLVVGEGFIAYFGEKEIYPMITEIFSDCGKTLEVGSEKNMDAITGLSGSGPAFVFTFVQAMTEGGVKSGLSYSDALKASIQTVKGSMKLLEEEFEKNPNIHPYILRNQVTSPGGTTIYGLDALEKGKFTHSVIQAVFQAFQRAKELGK